MAKENREYKDSLFVDLFYSDETAKKNLLSLYNALHGTDLKDEGLIRKVKIEDILYKNFNNDIQVIAKQVNDSSQRGGITELDYLREWNTFRKGIELGHGL